MAGRGKHRPYKRLGLPLSTLEVLVLFQSEILWNFSK